MPHIGGIMQSFYDWFISFSIMSSRFIHVGTYCRISFFLKGEQYSIYIPHFLYPFICQQTFSMLPYLGCVNSAAVNIRVLTSLWYSDSVLLDKYLEMGLLDHMVVLFLIFWGTCITFSIAAAPFYIPTNSVQGFQFYTPSPALVTLFYFFYNSHPSKCEVISHCSFDCISLIITECFIISNFECFFMYLLAICMSFLENVHSSFSTF